MGCGFERVCAHIAGLTAVAHTRRSVERLTDALPRSLGNIHETSVNADTGIIDTGVVIDGATSQSIGHIGGQPIGHPDYMLRVKREKLRSYLSHDADIVYDHKFTHYEEAADGVTAFFEDGSHIRGSVLIGADGSSSHVRTQLLPHQPSSPALFVPIVGMLQLSSKVEVENYQRIATAVFIACADGLRYMTGLLDVAADRSSANAYFAVCYKSDDPEEEIEWMVSATPDQLFEKAIEKTRPLDPSLTKYIHVCGVKGILTPPLMFREFLPPVSLPRGRVTLLGDALHTMMPFRGAGANTALLDACDLAACITQAQDLTDRDTVVKLLHQYSRVGCPRGRDMVAATHSAGEDMHMVFALEKILGRQLAELQRGARTAIV